MTTKSKKKPNSSHCVYRNSNLFCTHCGQEHVINYPIAISENISAINAFDKLHKNCKKTWVQPEPDMTQSVIERAAWWCKYGEHGTSSKTIWCVMTEGNTGDFKFDYEYLKRVMIPPPQYGHPSDPDDFRRCYLLLKAIPEWRKELDKMKRISPVWNKLVENWGYLTNYYEAYLKGGGNHLLSDMNTVMELYGC